MSIELQPLDFNPGQRRAWYVDGVVGDDDNPGTRDRPLKNAGTAAQRSSPGDTVHLKNVLQRADRYGAPPGVTFLTD